jgi:membrane-associated protease RseP (regulator of RpoE activity)
MNCVRFFQINELEPESPGIAAGIKAGDRVVSIDGIPVTKFGVRTLRRMGDDVKVGQKIIVQVLRPTDGSVRVMEVTVARKLKMPNQSPVSGAPAVERPRLPDQENHS